MLQSYQSGHLPYTAPHAYQDFSSAFQMPSQQPTNSLYLVGMIGGHPPPQLDDIYRTPTVPANEVSHNAHISTLQTAPEVAKKEAPLPPLTQEVVEQFQYYSAHNEQDKSVECIVLDELPEEIIDQLREESVFEDPPSHLTKHVERYLVLLCNPKYSVPATKTCAACMRRGKPDECRIDIYGYMTDRSKRSKYVTPRCYRCTVTVKSGRCTTVRPDGPISTTLAPGSEAEEE